LLLGSRAATLFCGKYLTAVDMRYSHQCAGKSKCSLSQRLRKGPGAYLGEKESFQRERAALGQHRDLSENIAVLLYVRFLSLMFSKIDSLYKLLRLAVLSL